MTPTINPAPSPDLHSPPTQPGQMGGWAAAHSSTWLLTSSGSEFWLSLQSRSPCGRMSISLLPLLQKNFIGVCAANRFKKITSSGSLTALGV